MDFGLTMPDAAKDELNTMLLEFETDKTFNHLKENWFNATAPCVQAKERGEGAQLKFFFFYFMVDIAAVGAKIVQDNIEFLKRRTADTEAEQDSTAGGSKASRTFCDR